MITKMSLSGYCEMVADWFSSGTITTRLGLGKDRGLG